MRARLGVCTRHRSAHRTVCRELLAQWGLPHLTPAYVCVRVCASSQDETVTSLAYASRVKLITNNANKNQDSEEVARLKAIIKALKVRACGCVRGH